MLCDIVAWLVVNSMRSEQLQWSMLCCQNVANIYRKNAFANLGALLDSSTKMVGTSGSSATGKITAIHIYARIATCGTVW